MNIDKAFPSKFLTAGDLEHEYEIVTIVNTKMEKVGQDGEKKPVVYFDEFEKGLVLNKTNKEAIKEVTGSADTDVWRGKKITLYGTEVAWGDKMVEAIRIRTRPLKGQPAYRFDPESGNNVQEPAQEPKRRSGFRAEITEEEDPVPF